MDDAHPGKPGDEGSPVTLTVPEALLREAESLGVNVSKAAERGLAAEVARARADEWIKRNQAAMESWNDDVARDGLPLEDLQLF